MRLRQICVSLLLIASALAVARADDTERPPDPLRMDDVIVIALARQHRAEILTARARVATTATGTLGEPR
jgi:hypothetical protein